jgi:hypothetical protein
VLIFFFFFAKIGNIPLAKPMVGLFMACCKTHDTN